MACSQLHTRENLYSLKSTYLRDILICNGETLLRLSLSLVNVSKSNEDINDQNKDLES